MGRDGTPAAPAAPAAPVAGVAVRTPLHDAAQAGDLARIEQLVAAGADLEAVEPIYHHTPLLLALEYGEPEAAALLLARGAGVAGDVGRAALALAARGGADAVIDTLVARGVTVAGSFALHRAATYGHVAAVRRLLAAGAPVDEAEPADQWTPLLVACMDNQLEVARVLLAAGAAVTVRDDDGNTALHWAVFGARPHEVHEYAKLGGPHDTYFVPQRDAPLVELLLAHHAPVDEVDADGDTALHQAALMDARAAAVALVAAGANRALRNRAGKTAYELARERHSSVAAVLAAP